VRLLAIATSAPHLRQRLLLPLRLTWTVTVMNRLAHLLLFVSVSAISVGGCSSSKTNGDAAAGDAGAGGGGADGEGGGAGQSEGGRGGGLAGAGGGQAGGAGVPVDAGACGVQGQTCSSSQPCCVPLICAGSCVMSPSDRNLKRDLAPVDGEQILDSLAKLPITTWRYKTESADARHIGPMAQDFKAKFGVGTDEKYILQVDADGVALAAIKTLNDRVNRLARENAELRREISRLRASGTNPH
jgi:hypothetical protein